MSAPSLRAGVCPAAAATSSRRFDGGAGSVRAPLRAWARVASAVSVGALAWLSTACGGAVDGGAARPAPDAAPSTVVADGGAPPSGSRDAGAPTNDGCEADLATDAHHCGACGHDCRGGACREGVCRPLVIASGFSDVGPFAVDPDAVYAHVDGARIVAITPDGGGTTTLAEAHDVRAIATQVDRVVWTELDARGGALNAVSKGGGPTVPLFSDARIDPRGVAAQGADVLFADWTQGVVYDVPRGGDAAALAAIDAHASAVALDADHVYFLTSDAADARRDLQKQSMRGGVVERLAADVGDAANLVVRGPTAYVTDARSRAVVAIPTAGGDARVLATASAPPSAIAADDAHVYFAAGGAVYRVAVAGGRPEPIAADAHAARVAVDDDAIYWTDPGAGAVVRLAK